MSIRLTMCCLQAEVLSRATLARPQLARVSSLQARISKSEPANTGPLQHRRPIFPHHHS
jgi:hypothetical protein